MAVAIVKPIQPSDTSAPASTTYLFDGQRSGRLQFSKGTLDAPRKLWSTRLPNDPPCSPESTAVFDRLGNIYFGCHDGSFYSLDEWGDVRWSFRTDAKIYSSPTWLPDSEGLCFAGGDGYLYCLRADGEFLWKQLIGKPVSTLFARRVHKYHRERSPTLHEVNRIGSALAWASPNVLSNGVVCVSGYSLGLTAFHGESGKLAWRVDLGQPAAHLTGVAVADDETLIAVGQQRHVFRIYPDGRVIWRKTLRSGFNAWGNPSIDEEHGTIYVPVSRREEAALVYAYDFEGSLRWRARLPEGTRGAIGISREDYVICCGFRGNLYFLDRNTGVTLAKIRATDGKMWTSASIDPDGHIFVSVIDSSEDGTGRVCCYDKHGRFLWDFGIGKGHSVPVIDARARLYVGSWRGEYFCLQT